MEDVLVGEEIAFNEIDEDIEVKAKGLKNMVIYKYQNKDVYIFDNHNHAFYFWIKSLKKGNFNKGCKLVHVDQHKDTREPNNYNVDIDNIDDLKEQITLLQEEYDNLINTSQTSESIEIFKERIEILINILIGIDFNAHADYCSTITFCSIIFKCGIVQR